MQKSNVLIVDDAPINRELLAFILQDHYQVFQAENGKQAIEMIESKERIYRLVLLDIQMPVMNGYDATLAIRKMKDTKKARIPIVAMTANAFAEDRQKALAVGMNDHVAKPVDTNILAPPMIIYL